MNNVFELEMPTLSQMLRAESEIGQQQTIKTVLEEARRMQGRVPDADLILAALRQIALIQHDTTLAAIVARLDDLRS